jgi:hypothetical protein
VAKKKNRKWKKKCKTFKVHHFLPLKAYDNDTRQGLERMTQERVTVFLICSLTEEGRVIRDSKRMIA